MNAKDIDYWLFSQSDTATFARARNDIPLEIVDDVSEEEKKRICSKIRDRLEQNDFYTFYVRLLVHLNDKSAVDLLRKWKKHFLEKRRIGKRMGITCSIEIRLLNDAIRYLKRL